MVKFGCVPQFRPTADPRPGTARHRGMGLTSPLASPPLACQSVRGALYFGGGPQAPPSRHASSMWYVCWHARLAVAVVAPCKPAPNFSRLLLPSDDQESTDGSPARSGAVPRWKGLILWHSGILALFIFHITFRSILSSAFCFSRNCVFPEAQ